MENKFPIGGFWGPVKVPDTPYMGASKNLITDEVYSLIKEAGINFISYIERDYTTQRDEVIANLELAEKNGISIFVKDKFITNDLSQDELQKRLGEYNQYSSFRGVLVCDEPGNAGYCQECPQIHSFSRIATILNQMEHACGYVNLFPKFGTYDDLDAAYENYVDEYLDTCSPRFLSYDYYPFLDAQTNKTCREYFEHLSFYSRKAKERNLPFMPFAEVGGYFWIAEEPFNQTIPTRGQMHWNVNNCLAFGAKGVQYFPLIQPSYFGVVSKTEQDFDRMALIGANGQPTKWYAYVKEQNAWIAEIEHILMEAQHKTVLVKGDALSQVSQISEQLDDKYLKDIVTENSEYGVLIGVFEYQNQPMYYVVNYDYDNPQKVILEFTVSHAMTVYCQSNACIQTEQKQCELVLKPGNAALILLNSDNI